LVWTLTGEKSLNLTDKRKAELRKFGLLLGCIFAIMGLLPFLKNKPLNLYLFFLGIFLTAIAITIPRILSPFYYIWMKAGHVLGRINSFIILSIIYYFVFTPMRVLMHFFSKERKFAFRSDRDTYWIRRGSENYKESMKRQF
jgi:hypothetical protein